MIAHNSVGFLFFFFCCQVELLDVLKTLNALKHLESLNGEV